MHSPVHGGDGAPSFIQPEPITQASIVLYDPRLADPYRGKQETDPTFVAVAEVGGAAIKIYERKPTTDPTKPEKRYRASVTDESSCLMQNPKEMNFITILRQVAFDIYRTLGRGIFQVPKSYLSVQNEGSSEIETLKVMSRIVEGCQDFELACTKDPSSGQAISFMDYLTRYRRLPEELLTPEGTPVPIKGLIGLLVVARIVSDSVVIGGSGGNIGFVWTRDETGQIVAAQAVKIDVGIPFLDGAVAKVPEEDKNSQIAYHHDLISLSWENFSSIQTTEFLQVLCNSSRYLNSPQIFDYLFYRNGTFNRSGTKHCSRKQIELYKQKVMQSLNTLLQIYHKELTELKQRYPTQIERASQIDSWASFLLAQQQQLVELAVVGLKREFQEWKRASEEREAELRARIVMLESHGRLSSSASSQIICSSIPATSISHTRVNPAEAFGAEQWMWYHGEVGEEPLLPWNIEEILNARCAFWKKMNMKGSHILMLMPETVNGAAYTLNLLEFLIMNCKNATRRTKLAYYWEELKRQIGNEPVKESYWVLMSRFPLPGTRSKTFEMQKAWLNKQTAEMNRLIGAEASVPTVLEGATCLLMEYAKTGKKLYPSKDNLFMTCANMINGAETHIGCFDEKEGFHIGNPNEYVKRHGLSCLWRLPKGGSESPKVGKVRSPTPSKLRTHVKKAMGK